jgi:hypothetical protein
MITRITIILIAVASICTSCKKDPEIIGNNDAPYYDEVTTLLVRNYVNRIYIDMIGREPLDIEMERDVQYLKDNDLAVPYRDSIILRLQTDTSFIEGDSSYTDAYHEWFYKSVKVRMVEGASEAEIYEILNPIIADRMEAVDAGDSATAADLFQKIKRMRDLLQAGELYRDDSIDIRGMYRIMIHNAVYNKINMNTFNFVNASFDNMFYRFPTAPEFFAGYEMVENNNPEILFGISGQNKQDYIQILIHSREFSEGLLTWIYTGLLQRQPASYEASQQMETFFFDHDVQRVQRSLMVTNEYANF